MGFFGSGDTKSSTNDNRIGVSDAGLSASGPSASAAREQSVATGAGSNSNVGNGTMVQGSTLTTQDKSLIGSTNTGTISYGLSADDVRSVLADVSSNINKSVQAQADAGNSALDATLNKLSDLAMTRATDGESGKNNIVLYIGFGLLALVAFIFWGRR